MTKRRGKGAYIPMPPRLLCVAVANIIIAVVVAAEALALPRNRSSGEPCHVQIVLSRAAVLYPPARPVCMQH